MDADESPHPDWCSPRRCTASSPPVNGHHVGVHRSAPGRCGVTDLHVVQTPDGTPAVELARDGAAVRLPLVEAANVGDAVEQLLRQAGLRARQSEPGS